MDRFILGENPRTMRGLSIIQLIEPITIILVHEGIVTFHHDNKCYHKHFVYKNSDGEIENYTFQIHHLFTTDFNIDNHEIKANKVMDKAFHWYADYLTWQDQQL